VLQDVPCDRVIRVVEGEDRWTELPQTKVVLGGR
jgi:hypothetical protein